MKIEIEILGNYQFKDWDVVKKKIDKVLITKIKNWDNPNESDAIHIMNGSGEIKGVSYHVVISNPIKKS